jgi:hypothetical protein
MLCEHYFNLVNRNCPICFPSEHYQIVPDNFTGKPLVEIFRNGNPWLAPGDRNFRFGTKKAAMILYCIKEIEQFAISNCPAEIYETCIRKISSADPTDEIYLQSFPEFERTDGEVVRMPFLRVDRVVNSVKSTHIGFGQLKATALVILEEELRDWFQSVDHMYA